MRSAPVTFSSLDESASKAPRFVVAIVYDVDSLFVTSHSGIANVPGTVIEGALVEPSIVSQRLKPDDAAAEIGSASFALVDLGGVFTSEVRERLAEGAGLRGKTVRFYLGYEELAFEDFQLVATQIVSGASYAGGKYSVQCLDIQRTLRAELFDPITTTLGATVLVGDTTITLTSTTGLQRVAHGPSYSDAPNATVGYIKIKNEIIRYANIAGNQLTGCERHVFGTVAAQYTVDPATLPERREKVSEYVYLELPAIKLAYALLTGKLWGTAETLPTKWHLGISPDLVTDDDFTRIGADLWNPADDAAGFVVRFEGLAKQDGKRFLEKEIYLLCGVYSPVYADGTLGLRRASAIREDASTVLTLDDSNSVTVGDLVHDFGSVHNAFVVQWSWNGQEFRRATAFVDPASRAQHGAAETYTLNFKGLHGGRHTDGVVYQLLDMIRDRYAGPPLRMSVDILHSLNKIEVGDIVRGRWSSVRDFTGQAANVDRAFEVQNVSVDHRSGKVSVELFGSTAEATSNAPTRASVVLADAFYSSAGTPLASAPGISLAGGILTAATQTLVGSDDLNASASIFYVDGDLTIKDGVVLRIAQNVQIRVRGFLKVDGQILGVGGGLPGVADPLGIILPGDAVGLEGLPGYVGNTQASEGINFLKIKKDFELTSVPVTLTKAQYEVAPRLVLANTGATLAGLPKDLRGGGGGPGGRYLRYDFAPTGGGTGAPGGAGLALVCRGMSFGPSGYIDLSGANAREPLLMPLYFAPVTLALLLSGYYSTGAGGGPGTCYVLVDGGMISPPDFSGNKFRSRAGYAPLTIGANEFPPNPLPTRDITVAPAGAMYTGSRPTVESPVSGYIDRQFEILNGADYSGSALVVQYVPGDELAVDDVEHFEAPPAPLAITTEAIEQGINVYLTFADFDFDTAQLFASIDNNRANAVKVGEGKFDTFRVRVPDGATRRFWARTRNANGYSAWYPSSATAGVLGGALGGLITRGGAEALGTTVRKPSSAGAGWNTDAYSVETYVGGAYVSFQASQTTAELMVGLNSDPESDASYTSLDFSWFIANGTTQIYESGASVGSFGAYTTNTVFSIKYDGQLVQYFKDGALVRSVTRPGASFFIDSSFNTPGGAIKSIKYGPMTTAPPIPWVTRGQCIATAKTIEKQGGADAWDSDAYSFEAYRRGAFVSFQPSQTSASLMVGLNTDPTADQSYASLDFAWYCIGDGNLQIYESGADLGGYGAYSANTVLAIAYDGKTVRYLKDGALMREVYAPDRTFHLDASFATPGGAIRNITFTPYGAATPVPFLSRSSNVIVSDTSAQKISGAAAWDSDFISINGYSTCFVEFKPSQTTAGIMVGLNSDPFTNQDYASIDAAWYVDGGGNLAIYESGTSAQAVGTYTTSTVLAITWDGASFRYYKDGALVRIGAGLGGATVFADASFHTPGGAINSLRFGPGTVLAQVDTPQMRPNATTDVFTSTAKSGTGSLQTISTSKDPSDIYNPITVRCAVQNYKPLVDCVAVLSLSTILIIYAPCAAYYQVRCLDVGDASLSKILYGSVPRTAGADLITFPFATVAAFPLTGGRTYSFDIAWTASDGPPGFVQLNSEVLRVEIVKR
jgi:hypothetical protein